ncbi:MAG: hypothetical protein ACRETT_01580, partial [Steroidobacteraceae bacterium]
MKLINSAAPAAAAIPQWPSQSATPTSTHALSKTPLSMAMLSSRSTGLAQLGQDLPASLSGERVPGARALILWKRLQQCRNLPRRARVGQRTDRLHVVLSAGPREGIKRAFLLQLQVHCSDSWSHRGLALSHCCERQKRATASLAGNVSTSLRSIASYST